GPRRRHRPLRGRRRPSPRPARSPGGPPAGLPGPAPGTRGRRRCVQTRAVTPVATNRDLHPVAMPPPWTPRAGAWHNAPSTENPMSKSQDTALRLMIVDDSPESAEAIVSTLRNAGIAVRPLRPSSAEEFASVVGAQPLDLVVAQQDSNMLPLAEVVRQVAATGKDVPVVALADVVDRESYIQAKSDGARALALREPPSLLLAVLRDAWADLEARRTQRRLEARLRETERRCDALIDSSRDPIAYVHEGMHIRANQAYLEMFGYPEFEDIEGMSLLDMVAPQDVEAFRQLLKGLAQGEAPPPRHELQARDIDGNAFPAAMEFTQAQYEDEPCIQVVIRRQELDPELAQEIE